MGRKTLRGMLKMTCRSVGLNPENRLGESLGHTRPSCVWTFAWITAKPEVE
jgi:hypothetical protein